MVCCMFLAQFEHILGRIFHPVSRALNNIGMAILIVMMLLVTTDVILRYLFNQPILGTLEVVEVMLVVIIFFILAQTMVKGKHVAAEVFVSRLEERGQVFLGAVNHFICLGLCVLMSWQLGAQAVNVLAHGDVTENLDIPIFPFIFVAAFGSAILCGILLKGFVNLLAQMIRGRWYRRIGLLAFVGIVVVLFTVAIWAEWLPAGMPPIMVGVIGIVLLLFLLALGMPVIFVLGIVGFWGFTYLSGINGGLGLLGTVLYRTGSNYGFAIIPLFMLMGTFCFYSGLSRDLYFAVHRWLGHLPGGLAMATVGACAGFAAVSGSSVATAATMGAVALPEMERYKYDPRLSTGCIAAGGTIGILIPPSIGFVIYGILTDQSIGKLFIAGLIPGILEALFYMVTIFILCKRNPLMGPPAPRTGFTEKLLSLRGVWGILALFLLVIGGIYLGVFTPSEAAAIGAFGALIFALGRRKLSWQGFKSSLVDTASNSGMALGILLTSMIFGYFLAVTRLPFELADVIAGLPIPRLGILFLILLVYLVLGCVMPALAMIVLTVPIFYPLAMALGYDALWFGVIIVRIMEMAQITPPIGINVFVIKGVAKDIPMYTIFRGIIPFLVADVLEIALLIAFPQIALLLPSLMG